jgi:hypothetical protein
MRHLNLAICLLAGTAAPLLASVDQGLLGLVPADSKVVIGIDAQRAKSSGFGQFVLKRQNSANTDLQGFELQTGFDPRRDLEYVLVASAGTPHDSSGLILARGLFDMERITTAARSKGARIENFADTVLISMKDKDQANAIAFPETGVAIAGPLSLVRGVLNGRSTPTVLDPRLTALINSADGNDVWFASTLSPNTFAPEVDPSGNAGPMANAQVLRSVREASGGVKLGEVVQLTFDAVTRSPQDANALADVVRFMTNMVQTKAQNDPRAAALAPALEQMKLESSGANVHLALQMPEKTLEQFEPASAKLSR